MKTIAKLIALVIAASLLASLVGCGATEEAAPTATQPTPVVKEPVTLRYATWNLGTEEENNIFRQMVKAYTDLNPHVTIEFVDMSGEGGWEALLTAYAAKGELPDVFMANNVPLYVQNGWVADLTDMVASKL